MLRRGNKQDHVCISILKLRTDRPTLQHVQSGVRDLKWSYFTDEEFRSKESQRVHRHWPSISASSRTRRENVRQVSSHRPEPSFSAYTFLQGEERNEEMGKGRFSLLRCWQVDSLTFISVRILFHFVTLTIGAIPLIKELNLNRKFDHLRISIEPITPPICPTSPVCNVSHF